MTLVVVVAYLLTYLHLCMSDDVEYHLRVHRVLDSVLRGPSDPLDPDVDRVDHEVHLIHIWSEYSYVIADSVYAFAETLALLNSAINPILYGCFNVQLKRSLAELCCPGTRASHSARHHLLTRHNDRTTTCNGRDMVALTPLTDVRGSRSRSEKEPSRW